MLPAFIFLILGILEGGRVLLLHQSMRAATSQSARAAAIFGNDLDADYNILQEVRKSTQARIPASEIDRIIVYEAANSTDPVPTQCLSGPVSGLCNVYSGADFAIEKDDLATCSPPSKARFWCPSDRKYAATGAEGNGPPDWIGIYIEARVPQITKLYGDNVTLDDTIVARIEATSRV